MIEFRRVVAYLRPYWKHILANIASNLLFVVFNFFSLALLAPFLGVLFGMVTPIYENPGLHFNTDAILRYMYYLLTLIQTEHGSMGAIYYVAGLFLFFTLLSVSFRYMAMLALTPIRNGVIKDLRNDLYDKILSLPLSFLSEQRRGDLLARMSNDMGDVEWSVSKVLQSMIKDPLNVVFFLAALAFINAQMLLMVLLILPLTAFIVTRIGKSLKRNADHLQTRYGSLLSIIEESISGLRIIKSYHAFDPSEQRFRDQNSDYTRYQNKIYKRIGLADPLTELLVVLAVVSVLWFGGHQVISGVMPTEVLILFITVFLRLISPAKSFSGAFFHVQKGAAALKRIFEVMDVVSEIQDDPNAQTIDTFKDEIRFDNISFRYPGTDRNVIEQLSLVIRRGQSVAIVGSSGSGKSTLIDLIPRFYEVQSGSLTIDSYDIKTLRLKDLRRMISLVSQQTFLFNDTIARNIAFGAHIFDRQRVEWAARMADAHDFIVATEKGYDTLIGDAGMLLSGGQRQRLNMARALYRKTPILLLDEATAALDTETETRIHQAMQALSGHTTMIIVAHRLSTVYNADTIVVMDQGRIVEEGTHQTLMAKGGTYARLVALQKLD